jgi:hypothetical protein
MSIDADDYVARVLEEEPPPAMHTDSSKWVAIHDALDPTAPRVGVSSGTGSLFTVAWVVGIVLGLIWVLRNGRTVFEQWQENVHRRYVVIRTPVDPRLLSCPNHPSANRRRHGIPDDDDRPFNVAYAAAALARRQREGQEKKKLDNVRQQSTQQESEWTRHGEAMGLRQRSSQTAGQPIPSVTWDLNHVSGAGSPFDSENAQPMFVQGTSTNPLGNEGTQLVPGESGIRRIQFR